MRLNRLLSTIVVMTSILFANLTTSAQNRIAVPKGNAESAIRQSTRKDSQKGRNKKEAESETKEEAYYAPIRYVIVYDEVIDLEPSERRVSILMRPSQFNRQNLIQIFNLVKKRFPVPVRLNVSIYTSLEAIETPEENEMTDDSMNTRFRRQENKLKAAFFKKDETEENFCYTTHLFPYRNRWAYPFKMSGIPLSPC